MRNIGPRPFPITILYHVNAGFPLLDESAELAASSRAVEPYDAVAASRLAGGLGLSLRFTASTLPVIEPGGERVMEVEFGVLEGAAEIDAFAEKVRRATA